MSAFGARSTPSVAGTQRNREGGPVDTHGTAAGTAAHQRWLGRARSRTIAAVVVTLLVLGSTTAVAANLITGEDVKNGSLTGKDIKDGSLQRGDLTATPRTP